MSHRRALDAQFRHLLDAPGDPARLAEVLAAGLRAGREQDALDALDRALATVTPGPALLSAWLAAVRAAGYGFGDPRLQQAIAPALAALTPGGRFVTAFSPAEGLVLRDPERGAVRHRAPLEGWPGDAGPVSLHADAGDARLVLAALAREAGAAVAWLAGWDQTQPERLAVERWPLGPAPPGPGPGEVLFLNTDRTALLAMLGPGRRVHARRGEPGEPPRVTPLALGAAPGLVAVGLAPGGARVLAVRRLGGHDGPFGEAEESDEFQVLVLDPADPAPVELGPFPGQPSPPAFAADGTRAAILAVRPSQAFAATSPRFAHWTDHPHALLVLDLVARRVEARHTIAPTARERLDRPRTRPLALDADGTVRALNRSYPAGGGPGRATPVPRRGPKPPPPPPRIEAEGPVLRIFDPEAGPDAPPRLAPALHAHPLVAVDAVAQGRRVATRDAGGTLVLFDVPTGAPVAHYPAARSGEDFPVVAPDGDRVVLRTREGILVLDPDRRAPPRRFPWPEHFPFWWNAAAVDPTGTLLVAGERLGRVLVRELARGRIVWPPEEAGRTDLPGQPVAVGWLPGKAVAYALYADRGQAVHLGLIDPHQAEPVAWRSLPPGYAPFAVALPDGPGLGLIGPAGLVDAFDDRVWLAAAAGARAVAVAPDGSRIAWAGPAPGLVQVAHRDHPPPGLPAGRTEGVAQRWQLPGPVAALAFLADDAGLVATQAAHLRLLPV